MHHPKQQIVPGKVHRSAQKGQLYLTISVLTQTVYAYAYDNPTLQCITANPRLKNRKTTLHYPNNTHESENDVILLVFFFSAFQTDLLVDP